jgi:hypothetical protein
MKKKEKTYKPKEVSNPAATGGAGNTFESRVQASRLLAMCLGHPIPGKTDGRVVELRFQSRVHEHHTDDLVCTFEDRAGVKSRVLMQMKRSMTAREKDDAFSDAIGSAWVDFGNSTKFTRGLDSFFLVYDIASANAMGAAIQRPRQSFFTRSRRTALAMRATEMRSRLFGRLRENSLTGPSQTKKLLNSLST